jgi:hypothetical protein
MGKGTTTKNDILKYLFQATAPGWAANAHFYAALHTSDPGVGGTQLTNEAAYTGYARVEIERDVTGWTVVANLVSNTTNIEFPVCTGAPETDTHWSIGTLDSGAGQILYSGVLVDSLDVIAGLSPSFLAGDIDITDN